MSGGIHTFVCLCIFCSERFWLFRQFESIDQNNAIHQHQASNTVRPAASPAPPLRPLPLAAQSTCFNFTRE